MDLVPMTIDREASRSMDLLTSFDRTFVINLAERRDRRRQTLRELRRHFSPVSVDERVAFHEAVRPDDAGPFRSVGARGVFLSNLEILKMAARDGLESVLVMEDDVRFTSAFRAHSSWLLDELARRHWDLLHIGYLDRSGVMAQHDERGPVLVDFAGQVSGAQCIGFRRSVFEPLIDHLETILAGEPGDRLRGPMPIDGAFNTFKWCHPEMRRLVPVPLLVDQRSSRSDITPKRHDRIGLLRPVLDVGRAAAERIRGVAPR